MKAEITTKKAVTSKTTFTLEEAKPGIYKLGGYGYVMIVGRDEYKKVFVVDKPETTWSAPCSLLFDKAADDVVVCFSNG